MQIKRNIALAGLAILVGLSLTFSQVLAAGTGLPADKKTPPADPPGIQQPGQNGEKKEGKQAEKEIRKQIHQDEKADKSKKPENAKDLKVTHTPPAWKAGEKAKGEHKNIRGTITTVNEDSLVVALKNGDMVTILLDENTTVHVPTQGKSAGQGFVVGMEISVHTILAPEASQPQAISIHVIPGKPEHIHRVGTVTAYTPGESITITAKDGSTSTFDISGAEYLSNAGTEIVIGETRVTIISPRDVAGGELSARAVVIHPAKTK